MLYISEATLTDTPTIIGIAQATWWRAYGQILSAEQIRYMLDTLYAPEVIRRQIADRTQTFLIMMDDGRPQGFAAYGERADETAVYKLHKLYVLPQTQKTGVGKALLLNITQRLLAQNIHTLDLNVNRYNSAKLFYEKNGFKVIREEDIPIGPYWMNDYVMRLEF